MKSMRSMRQQQRKKIDNVKTNFTRTPRTQQQQHFTSQRRARSHHFVALPFFCAGYAPSSLFPAAAMGFARCAAAVVCALPVCLPRCPPMPWHCPARRPRCLLHLSTHRASYIPKLDACCAYVYLCVCMCIYLVYTCT